ncbi:MAG TPA: sulfatase, partial [Candidatus Polarisedimenticolia bacterium]|nr:sulfatase [Candidatus Polarisedimenticolia bacterium]
MKRPPPARRGSRRAAPRRARLPAWALLPILVTAAAVYLATRGPGGYAGPTGGASLLLITVDGLRTDRVGAYGPPAVPTPSIDRLAAAGTLFEQAFTASVQTLPAHATILTGLSPAQHGAREDGERRLPARVRTLAQALAGLGFRTAAVVGSPALASGCGLEQGFEHYDDDLLQAPGESGRRLARPARAVTDAALRKLAQDPSRRFFLWVQYADPAIPAAPPRAQRDRLEGRPHDANVALVDAEIGRLLAALDAAGSRPRTLVVAAGAHGLGLGDHGEALSGSSVYDETARVPLVISLPPHLPSGARVRGVVRTVDLVPTLLELLRVEPAAMPQTAGTPLWPRIAGGEPGGPPPAYVEARGGPARGWPEAVALRDDRHAYLHAAPPELYDVLLDPGQRSNLA